MAKRPFQFHLRSTFVVMTIAAIASPFLPRVYDAAKAWASRENKPPPSRRTLTEREMMAIITEFEQITEGIDLDEDVVIGYRP